MLRWPGHIPPGRVTDQVGITMDLSATIVAVTNSPVPPETKLEGINLLPILEGRSPEVERTLFWRTESGRSQKAVRSGDWKLLIDGTQELLFNVRTDVGERRDLAREHPETVARLRPLIATWEADVDAEAKINVPRGGAAAAARGGPANVVTDPAGRTRPID
jgi:arylsulfatase A-like enzyme